MLQGQQDAAPGDLMLVKRSLQPSASPGGSERVLLKKVLQVFSDCPANESSNCDCDDAGGDGRDEHCDSDECPAGVDSGAHDGNNDAGKPVVESGKG